MVLSVIPVFLILLQVLYFAALEGHIACVEMLLKHGAKVNLASTDGKLPLHASANDGHAEVSLMLITAGAAVDAIDMEAKMPIHYAAAEGRANVIKLLAEVGGPEGRASAIQPEFQGCHPLHLAARQVWTTHTPLSLLPLVLLLS